MKNEDPCLLKMDNIHDNNWFQLRSKRCFSVRSGSLPADVLNGAPLENLSPVTESRNVAVIGAGAAGLITARELRREGHRVTVFEKSSQLGGVWVYNPRVETDPLSKDPNREILHTSVYKSLRTNLPRQQMSFTDYPFNVTENGKLMSFPRHEELLKFLNNFANDFGITELIRFNTKVIRAERVDSEKDQWIVESKTDESIIEEVYDAVVICNCRFRLPKPANIPGINNWPGEQVHSHNYRVPEPFKDKIVVVIGDGPTGSDLSLDVATLAKEVHHSTRSTDIKASKMDNYENVWVHSKIDHVDENGGVTFLDGTTIHADVLVHCTGYKYDFPYLQTNGLVTVDDNRVGPLYQHVFPPKFAPSLCFVGVPYQVCAFLVFELQAKWVAQVLSGKVLLPSEEEMETDMEEYFQHLEKIGILKRHTHRLHLRQFEYMDWVAAQVGMPPVDAGIKEGYSNLYKYIDEVGYGGYRDMWDVKNSTP